MATVASPAANISFRLPDVLRDLVAARDKLRTHYVHTGLSFSLDGKILGDVGEAIAAEHFGVRLVSSAGIDGFAPDGRTVQIKVSASNGGARFRNTKKRADLLLFMLFDLDAWRCEIVYNGPEAAVIDLLPVGWAGQREVTLAQLRARNNMVAPRDRLPFLNMPPSIDPATTAKDLGEQRGGNTVKLNRHGQ